jgi:hypothetical protein
VNDKTVKDTEGNSYGQFEGSVPYISLQEN